MGDTPLLLLSMEPARSDELRERLRLNEAVYRWYIFDVWQSDLGLQQLFAWLPSLLRENAVRSAAILEDLPTPDRQWVAVEYVGTVVVSAALEPLVQQVAEGWERLGFIDEGRLVRYAPSATLDRTLRGEAFRTSLESGDPLTVAYEVPEDLADATGDGSWFGRLAAPGHGGVVALLTMSNAQGPGRIALRNPSALNMEISPDLLHAVSLIGRGELNVRAIGLRSQGHVPAAFIRWCTGADPQESAGALALHERFEAAMRALDDSPEYYRLLLYLEAPLGDPVVTLPRGAVFEQAGFTGVQTLAAAAPVRVVVDPGSFVPVVLPSWCLNERLNPPNGEPVSLTILRYMGPGPQKRVWTDVETRLAASQL